MRIGVRLWIRWDPHQAAVGEMVGDHAVLTGQSLTAQLFRQMRGGQVQEATHGSVAGLVAGAHGISPGGWPAPSTRSQVETWSTIRSAIWSSVGMASTHPASVRSSPGVDPVGFEAATTAVPDQFADGHRHVRHGADTWSISLTMRSMVCGFPPWLLRRPGRCGCVDRPPRPQVLRGDRQWPATVRSSGVGGSAHEGGRQVAGGTLGGTGAQSEPGSDDRALPQCGEGGEQVAASPAEQGAGQVGAMPGVLA